MKLVEKYRSRGLPKERGIAPKVDAFMLELLGDLKHVIKASQTQCICVRTIFADQVPKVIAEAIK